ncbi:extracellular solute-binding protein [Lapidilactobacillus gannanensis]|uniref:Extracellular solute-binding protein n=2 Tax=Lapidilactobacillus gannanensis TaxID=2486002 RepID=A0ABW4BLA2_9LACO
MFFWNPFTGPDGKNMQAMVDQYNKTNPKYKVKNISMKEGDMYTKIPTVVNSGKNIPDLNIVHAERIKQYKDNNMLISYDKYLGDYPEIKASNYVTEAWNIGDLDGKRYSLPLDIHTFQMYYNKDLVKKYAPKALDDNIVTFDEIQAAGEAAKKDKITGLGVTWFKPNFLSLYAQYGGKLTKNGTDVTLDNADGKKTLEKYVAMYKSGITSRDGQDPAQLFQSGKEIFYPEGIWMQNQVKAAKFEWGMINAPQLSSDLSKAVNWSSSHQFVMFKSKDRDAAKTKAIMKFIAWVRTHSQEWAKSGQNPASLAIKDDAAYKKMGQSFLINTPEEQATMKIFDYKYNGFVADSLDKHVGDAIFGKVSIEKTLQTMQKEVQGKIDKDQANKK